MLNLFFYISQRIFSLKNYLLILCTLFYTQDLCAQLDYIHYLPPIKPQALNNIKLLSQSEVILSTPSTSPITVHVQEGVSGPSNSYIVSKGNPVVITQAITSSGNSLIALDSETGYVVSNKGMVLSSSDLFLVTYKAKSDNNKQAEIYTAKGRAALGQRFRWAGIPLQGMHAHKNSYLSIMAIEDNTQVTISGMATGSTYRLGTNANGLGSGTIQVNLNQRQCYILESIMNQTAVNYRGFLGVSIVSNKPIVVNNGHALGGYALSTASNSRDILMEQNIPESLLGTEYVAIQGNGTDATHRAIELVVLIATVDNTSVQVNGANFGTIAQAGDYMVIDGNNYNNGGLFIKLSQPAYCYQQVLGANSDNTNGMNLIPPVGDGECLPLTIDDIPLVENNNGLIMQGGIQLFTEVGATVAINGVTVPSSDLNPLQGTSKWMFYRSGALTGNITVSSTKSMAVGVITVDGNAGCSGYYSGFGKKSSIVASNSYYDTLTSCFDTLYSENKYFDRYEWLLDGALLAGEQDSFLVVNQQSGSYKLVTHWNTCVDTTALELVDCDIALSQGISLRAEVQGGKVQLTWSTLPDIDHYIVQYTKDGLNWEDIQTVEQNGEERLTYMHQPAKVGKSYYRLLYGDNQFSHIQVVSIQQSAKNYLLGNPVSQRIQLQNLEEPTLLRLSNHLGVCLKQERLTSTTATVEIEDIDAGIYYMQLLDNQGRVYSKCKVLKIR